MKKSFMHGWKKIIIHCMTEYPEECKQMHEKCIGCEDMTNNMNQWIKKKLTELRTEHGNKCMNENCGSITELEFAHKIKTDLEGMSRGRKERYYDIKNNPKCYVLLCKKCHSDIDSAKELTKIKL